MNYYAAKARESDGKYDYTCENKRDGTYPIGYCAGPESPYARSYAAQLSMASTSEQDRGSIQVHLDRYHTDGHDTADGACACFRRFLLDTRVFIGPERRGATTLHRCEAPDCMEYTAGQAEVTGYQRWYLCNSHRHRGMVEQLFIEIGESWSSY